MTWRVVEDRRICDVHSSNGGPAWTRTRNQTVMSAGLWRKIRAKSALRDQDISRLCAFVHGFLPDNWWHGRPPRTANRPRPDGSAFRPSSRYRVKSGLGKDKPFR